MWISHLAPYYYYYIIMSSNIILNVVCFAMKSILKEFPLFNCFLGSFDNDS